jgi:hypothetical protein
VTIKVNSLGMRPDPFGGEFEAIEVRHEPYNWDTWPTGPVFPEGHLFQAADDKVYEVVVPRTVEERMPGSVVRYVHIYLCRTADPRDGAR